MPAITSTAGELAGQLQGDLRGDPAYVVRDAQTIERAGPDDLVFASDDKNLRKLATCRAGVALVPRSLASRIAPSATLKAVIAVDEPQAAFLTALAKLRPLRPRTRIGLSHAALVSPMAHIGEGTNIHPGAIVGDGAAIGKNCEIHPGVVIGPGCRVGDDVILFPNVVLYADVSVGNRVILHAGAVIGADGFGYRLVKGRHVKLPHHGTVRIEDDVEIGANATVDRAMIGETVIGEGTKIDNLVMIAHNCQIGKHNIYASLVGVAGSVTTGDYVVCAGQAGVADHVHLADGCTLGAKAAAHKDMPGGVFHGSPALPETEALRLYMSQRKLPEMKNQLRELQAQMKDMAKKLAALTEAADAAKRPAA